MANGVAVCEHRARKLRRSGMATITAATPVPVPPSGVRMPPPGTQFSDPEPELPPGERSWFERNWRFIAPIGGAAALGALGFAVANVPGAIIGGVAGAALGALLSFGG